MRSDQTSEILSIRDEKSEAFWREYGHPRTFIRKFFPEATDDECDYILWEKTGWPCFFNSFPQDFIDQVIEFFNQKKGDIDVQL